MKKRYILFLLFIYISSKDISAQNLVLNPSFEEYLKCPDDEAPGPAWNGYVKDWGSINSTTKLYAPSPGFYFNSDCFKNFDFDSLYWYVQKDSISIFAGKGMAQIPMTSYADKQQNKKYYYYFTKLKTPLQKDSTYRVEYYVHLNRYYQLQDHFGVTFIKDTAEIYAQNGYQYLTDDYVGIRDTFLGPDRLWHKVQGCYIAKGGEQWLLLGELVPFEDIHFHPWKPLWGRNGTGVCVAMMDDFYVGKATRIPEKDHQIAACDGQTITLPPPLYPNAKILDTNLKEVSKITLHWPESYTFYYTDACFGRLGTIDVNASICLSMIDTTILVCDNEMIPLNKLVSADFEIRDQDNRKVETFQSDQKGTFTFQAVHKTYGPWGNIRVEVATCDHCNVFLPNVFNINSAFGNDKWLPKSNCSFEEYHLSIFDHWGNQVFDTSNPDTHWDGSFKSKPCNIGVYVYLLEYRFRHPVIPQRKKIISGDITLIK